MQLNLLSLSLLFLSVFSFIFACQEAKADTVVCYMGRDVLTYEGRLMGFDSYRNTEYVIQTKDGEFSLPVNNCIKKSK